MGREDQRGKEGSKCEGGGINDGKYASVHVPWQPSQAVQVGTCQLTRADEQRVGGVQARDHVGVRLRGCGCSWGRASQAGVHLVPWVGGRRGLQVEADRWLWRPPPLTAQPDSHPTDAVPPSSPSPAPPALTMTRPLALSSVPNSPTDCGVRVSHTLMQ